MVGIIIASHGEFADGIKQSGSMIFGNQEKVESVTFMPSEGPEDLQRKLREAVDKLETEEILFLVDLWGGSPFNQANILFEEDPEHRAIVAGLSLPMLIESYASRFSMNTSHEIAKAIAPTAIEGVKIRPEALQPEEKKEEKSVLARIDTRLLHGQVATSWTKATNPNRIIVVSDKVAKDDLRKKLIEQAAPTGVRAHVIPLNKLVEVYNDPRFGDTKALLLFETPQEALEVIEKGVHIDELNIGSMAHSVGKVQVSNALSLDQDDVETYKKLRDLGVKMDVRKVVSDSPADIFKLIEAKSNEGLKL